MQIYGTKENLRINNSSYLILCRVFTFCKLKSIKSEEVSEQSYIVICDTEIKPSILIYSIHIPSDINQIPLTLVLNSNLAAHTITNQMES